MRSKWWLALAGLLACAPAQADPVSIGAWVTSWALTSGLTYSATTAIALGYAALAVSTIGLSVGLGALSAALTGRPRVGGTPARDIVVKTTTGPRRIVYGEATVGGTLVFIGTCGTTNEFLDFVVVVAGHEVDAITDVWFDDELIPNSAIAGGAAEGGGVTDYDTDASPPQDGQFRPHDGRTVAYIYKFLGTGNQQASEQLKDTLPGGAPNLDGYAEWTDDHRLQGCAYVHVRLRRDSERYSNGPPGNFRFRVRGAKVYDPRLDSTNGGSGTHRYYDASTWAWSDNPALCVADFVTGGTIANDGDPVRRRGFGADVSDVDWASVIAAANICDEQVAVPPESSPSTFQARYRCDGALSPSDDTPDADCLEQLLTSMLGQVVFTAGTYRVYAGAYDTPLHTLNEDDLAGGVQYVTAQGRSERYNTVRGTRFDDTQGHEVEFLPRTAAAYVAADGRSLYREIELPFTTNEWRAQRIAQVILRRSREQRTVVWQGKLSCARIAVWETVEVTCAELNLDAATYRCISRTIRGAGADALVELTLREENTGTYADPYISDYDSVTVTDEPGYVVGALDPPTAFTATGAPGGIVFEITPDISTPTDAVYEIWEYSASTPVESASRIWTGAASKIALPFADASPTHSGYYWVRARRNSALSTFYPVGAGVYAKAAEGAVGPPGEPGEPGASTPVIRLSVAHRTLVAYADGELVAGQLDYCDGYLTVWEGATEITHQAGVVLSVYAAVNCTGTINTSDSSPVANEQKGYYKLTSMETTASQASLGLRVVYDGNTYETLFTVSKSYAGYQIVSTLPATNLFCGRLVYLETDGKLYRYDCTKSPQGWTAAVPTTDLTGEIDGALIEAGTIEITKFASGIAAPTIVSALPSSGNYEGRLVYLTTDNKLYRYTGSAWTAAVASTDITGTLTSAQIESLAASKITGQLTDAQIAAIAAAKLTGQITSTQITDGAISTPKLAAGSVTTATLAAGAVTTETLAAGSVTATTIASGAVTTAKLAAGSVTASTIAALTITGDKIAANTIAGSKILADSITAGQIAAGAIGASEIAAGAITAEKLLVRSGGGALNNDPDMRDASAWTGNVSFTTVTDGKVGTTVARADGVTTTLIGVQRIALDPTKVYRVRCWARGNSVGKFYLGVALQDSSGNNITGDGTYWYYPASAVSLTTSWTAFTGTFGAGTAKTFPSTARTMVPLCILNYNVSSGWMEVQDVRIEEVLPATLIADGAITTNKIVTGAITADKVAANAITAGKIAANAIIADNIQAGVVTAAKMATNTITAASGILANAVITTAKIADLQVEEIKIANGAVTAGYAQTFAYRTWQAGPYANSGSFVPLAFGNVNNIVRVYATTPNTGRVLIVFTASVAAVPVALPYSLLEFKCIRSTDGTAILGQPEVSVMPEGGMVAWSFIDNAPVSGSMYYTIYVTQNDTPGGSTAGMWKASTLFASVFKK